MSVVIVGASVGGLTVAEALRRKGYTGRIQVVGDEPHPPYDRPPLSKEILTGDWPVEKVYLRDPDRLSSLDVDWLLGRPAVGLRRHERVVELDGGRLLPYETLVIATGLRPRSLPGVRAYTLRSLEEALDLRRALRQAQRVAVVGAGVLGCEIAAAARTLGKTVTLVDPAPVPMLRTLGADLGARVGALHHEHGVRLRAGELAEFGDADLVVAAIGSIPATGWLAGSGLDAGEGVLCDSRLRAAPDVYAVGDVARWPDPVTGTASRLETRTNATEQALVVAANILGEDRPYQPVPYFWSDQYKIKIQVHGTIGPHDQIRIVDGDPDEGRFAALAEHDGRVTAAIGWNHPRGARDGRRLLLEGVTQ